MIYVMICTDFKQLFVQFSIQKEGIFLLQFVGKLLPKQPELQATSATCGDTSLAGC